MRPVLLLAALVVAGCQTLPRAGPDRAAFQDAIADGAGEFLLIEADRAVVAALQARAAQGPARLPDADATSGALLSVGDEVEISIFEPTAGGPFSGGLGDAGSATRLPIQRVDDAGAVQVPFAGAVRIADATAATAAERIERALSGQAVSPQVIVSVRAAPGRVVTVLGDAVNGGGRVPLAGLDERVLDVVAAAGGLSQPVHETALRLTRDSRTVETPLPALLEDPSRNVRVRAGDVIAVVHAPQRFSVLGAVTRNAQLPFGQSSLTLHEALAKASGLLDDRADPEGVFIARLEQRDALAATPGVDMTVLTTAAGPLAGPLVPTVYRADFSQPDSMIGALRFPMRDGDVIYVANAESTPTQKLFGIVSQVLPVVNTTLLIPSLTD